ncbi:ead/Ea22-like family protein [Pseudomonas brassicacearum]|uniref:ead/Ea22-like family protein n=1 Tax=Pseudomonas brassicacearum TaxID=930166 RepID=UPI00071F3E3C|nr:ead/Ea22-like family protein [Pseudomonas brassicacearum]ALQ01469.1 hypothetical protein AK973_1020 [Pseudomonas brassicacearum]
MTDYTELKRMAEAATPGPWIADNSHHEGSINAADRHIGMVSMYARRPNDIIENFSNQAFIAAANPAAILTLISENSRLNDGAHMRAINSLRQDCRDLKSERDQLKAENAGLHTGYKAYEQVNAELRAENERLRDGMVQIIEMNRMHAECQYGDPEKAEAWSCVTVARAAMGQGEQP